MQRIVAIVTLLTLQIGCGGPTLYQQVEEAGGHLQMDVPSSEGGHVQVEIWSPELVDNEPGVKHQALVEAQCGSLQPTLYAASNYRGPQDNRRMVRLENIHPWTNAATVHMIPWTDGGQLRACSSDDLYYLGENLERVPGTGTWRTMNHRVAAWDIDTPNGYLAYSSREGVHELQAYGAMTSPWPGPHGDCGARFLL